MSDSSLELLNNMVVFESQHNKLVLPHADAQLLFKALRYAEVIETPYREPITVKPLEKHAITFNFIGAQEYSEAKMRSLIVPE